MSKSSRRTFLVASAGLGLSTIVGLSACQTSQTIVASSNNGNIQTLLDGNLRFQNGKQQWPNQTNTRRQDVASKQSPFAIVLGCVDSHVPPELVFDQGLGDLFTIRTAGHVLDRAALGSIEFGVVELGISLLVVLGHQKCGAVTAAIDAIDKQEEVHGDIDYLVRQIEPSIQEASGTGNERIENVVRKHIQKTVRDLSDESTSTILSQAVKDGKLTIVGCRYDLGTGAVSLNY
jgi:carbonic anhydrase